MQLYAHYTIYIFFQINVDLKSIFSIATVADLVLQPVLDIVAKEIHDDWKVLATSLKVRPNVISDYDKSLSTTEEKMKRCFEAKFNNISWKELKNQLIKINRGDVVKMLCASTYLTTGMFLNLVPSALRSCCIVYTMF